MMPKCFKKPGLCNSECILSAFMQHKIMMKSVFRACCCTFLKAFVAFLLHNNYMKVF